MLLLLYRLPIPVIGLAWRGWINRLSRRWRLFCRLLWRLCGGRVWCSSLLGLATFASRWIWGRISGLEQKKWRERGEEREEERGLKKGERERKGKGGKRRGTCKLKHVDNNIMRSNASQASHKPVPTHTKHDNHSYSSLKVINEVIELKYRLRDDMLLPRHEYSWVPGIHDQVMSMQQDNFDWSSMLCGNRSLLFRVPISNCSSSLSIVRYANNKLVLRSWGGNGQ